ncbi:hypothetical protein [Actinomadura livida]|uniref:Uncharacterized protein n=1 Tax=Actinomadura livida TaxID=79909 RepID=A0A7W7IKZ0_9ACTN|nr:MULTISPECIES: hypothetical protein [Actinomadura]MBB4779027.1 hypothetical protein [Actinomadura catellatispora]GGU01156.1 hypothetical protein GCM10010208_25940 [Actinomadura livida]
MVEVTLDMDAGPTPLLILQSESWEIHVWAPLKDLSRLSEIREATWPNRRSLQAGICAGTPVFWSLTTDDQATLLIGQDDETWDAALLIPLTTVDAIAALTRQPP